MKKSHLSSVAFSLFFISIGFVSGFFVTKSSKSNNLVADKKWISNIKTIGQWAAAIVVNDEVELVVVTSPHSPQGPIRSVGYRHNRNMLLRHQDEDGDGNFEKLQFNDPVTGQVSLYFFQKEEGIYRPATTEEIDKRSKEMGAAPGE
jgi:hypothetical protein